MPQPSDIILNPQGATKGAYDDAKTMLNHVYSSTPDSGAKLVQVDDKFVVEHNMGALAVAIWTEDGQDVCLQVYPPDQQIPFEDPPGSLPRDLNTPPVVFQIADRFFGEALQNLYGVQVRAEWYDHRRAHRIKLVHDKALFGMDLLMLRMCNLRKLPDWEVPVAKALRELNQEMLHRWTLH